MADLLSYFPLFQETLTTIRSRLDADANANLAPDDPRYLDTREGTLYQLITQLLLIEIARVYDAISVELPAAASPLYAWGTYLDDHAAVFGLARKAAVSSEVEMLFIGDPDTLITAGSIVSADPTDDLADSLEFVTTETGTISGQLAKPTGLTANGFTTGGSLPAATYLYRVTTVSEYGETDATAEVSVTTTGATSRVVLDWADAAGARAYRIYRSTVVGALGQRIATVGNPGLPAPTGLDGTTQTTGGSLAAGTHYYKVTALNDDGESLASAEFSIVTTGATSQVSLTWNAVTGATSYRVYRGTTTNAQDRYFTTATPSLTDTGAAATVAPLLGSGHTDTGAVAPSASTPPTINETAGVRLPALAAEANSAGNLAAGAIINLDTPNAGVDRVTNELPSIGGSDPEDDEDLRERILLQFEGGHAGNEADYRRWALGYPGVGRAYVKPVWQGPGTVQVVVMTATGDPTPQAIVDGLQDFLDPDAGLGKGEAPIGAIVTVQTPSVRAIDVVATVGFEPDFSLDGQGGTIAKRAAILQALSDYVDQLQVDEDVIYDHVKAQFFTVDGVLSVTGLTVEGGTSDVAISGDPPEVAQLTTPTLS